MSMKDIGWKLFFAAFGILQVIAVLLLTMVLSRLDRVEGRAGDLFEWKREAQYRIEQVESEVSALRKTSVRTIQ